MKRQTVKTDKGYVAISDEDNKEGDCIWYKNTKMIGFAGEDNIDKFYYAKIIATDTTFKLEGIPQFELEKDDWQSEIKKVFPRLYNSGMDKYFIRHTEDGFMEGYEAAQSKGCFTEEDMRNSIRLSYGQAKQSKLSVYDVEERIITSLKQPKKLVAIEIAMVPPTWSKSEQYPDGLLTIKQYFYE